MTSEFSKNVNIRSCGLSSSESELVKGIQNAGFLLSEKYSEVKVVHSQGPLDNKIYNCPFENRIKGEVVGYRFITKKGSANGGFVELEYIRETGRPDEKIEGVKVKLVFPIKDSDIMACESLVRGVEGVVRDCYSF